jgi:hypothetical protein
MPVPSPDRAELRAFFYLDRLQPRYAAFLGTVIQGDLPVQGMAALFVEVAPGNEVFRLVDVAAKLSRARPGSQVVEREFGLFEFHSFDQAAVQAAGRAVLDELGLEERDRIAPSLSTMRLIQSVDSYQAQLLNRLRRGTTLIPGRSMLVVECAPAAYSNLLANEAEKSASVELVHASGLGRFGRLWLSGAEKEIQAAQQTIEQLVAGQTGRRNA